MSELNLPPSDDVEVVKAGIVQSVLAEVAEVLLDVALNYFAAAGAFDQTFLEDCIPAERGISSPLRDCIRPVLVPVAAGRFG